MKTYPSNKKEAKKKPDAIQVITPVKEKNKGGQPSKYPTEKLLIDAIQAYLKFCSYGQNGRPRLKPLMPNKAGLCVFLDISRETYSQYRAKYPDTIKRADSTIEDSWVQRLNSNAPTGAIFYLKNAFKETYKDRHQTDLTTKGEKIEAINETQLERIARRILDGRAAGQA